MDRTGLVLMGERVDAEMLTISDVVYAWRDTRGPKNESIDEQEMRIREFVHECVLLKIARAYVLGFLHERCTMQRRSHKTYIREFLADLKDPVRAGWSGKYLQAHSEPPSSPRDQRERRPLTPEEREARRQKLIEMGLVHRASDDARAIAGGSTNKPQNDEQNSVTNEE